MPEGIIRFDEGWRYDDGHLYDEAPHLPLPSVLPPPRLKEKGKHMDFDIGPLVQPNVPGAREYMARGMVADDEIGVDSDIASITYAG